MSQNDRSIAQNTKLNIFEKLTYMGDVDTNGNRINNPIWVRNPHKTILVGKCHKTNLFERPLQGSIPYIFKSNPTPPVSTWYLPSKYGKKENAPKYDFTNGRLIP